MNGSPAIRNAGVIVDDEGRILEVGPFTSLRPGYDMRYAHAVLMPGVVNSHIHLTDAPRETPVPGGEGLVNWVQRLLSSRSEVSAGERDTSVRQLLRSIRDSGTAAIGEVTNDLAALDAIRDSGLHCRVIYELIGFRRDRAGELIGVAETTAHAGSWDDTISYAVGAHAPYSVSPELMQQIVSLNERLGACTYQHLAEDPDERLLYESATGPWSDLLEHLGAWEPAWKGLGISPIELYDGLGLLNDRFVAVHLTDATTDEIDLLGQRGVKAILSPTSNLHITGRLPDLEAIAGAGMTIALGTDGRGSNPSMDVFDEARLLHSRWPDLSPGLFLDALTANGADVLGLPGLGRIEAGAVPGLVSVTTAVVSDDLRRMEEAILTASVRRRVA
jgi:cytosine/adenosine deaminase-related metal-dependent hydrolase